MTTEDLPPEEEPPPLPPLFVDPELALVQSPAPPDNFSQNWGTAAWASLLLAIFLGLPWRFSWIPDECSYDAIPPMLYCALASAIPLLFAFLLGLSGALRDGRRGPALLSMLMVVGVFYYLWSPICDDAKRFERRYKGARICRAQCLLLEGTIGSYMVKNAGADEFVELDLDAVASLRSAGLLARPVEDPGEGSDSGGNYCLRMADGEPVVTCRIHGASHRQKDRLANARTVIDGWPKVALWVEDDQLRSEPARLLTPGGQRRFFKKMLHNAQNGESFAQWRVGIFYYLGQGCDRDPVTGAHWLDQAAHHGNAWGAFAMGWIHEHGTAGRAASREAARTYYAQAARNGPDVFKQHYERFKLADRAVKSPPR